MCQRCRLGAGVLKELVHVRMRVLAAEASADCVPAWLMHWQVLRLVSTSGFDASFLLESEVTNSTS